MEQHTNPGDENLNLERAVKRQINKALVTANGKGKGPGGAATLLGINPSTLRNRMKKMGISFGKSQ